MSFTLINEGNAIPIAKEEGGRKVIYLELEPDDPDSVVTELITKKPIMPLPKETREVTYIAGSQGSGKSYVVASYIRYWLKLYKHKPVYVISRLDRDETFETCFGDLEKKIQRLKPSIDWLADKFKLEEFADSLVVFDDIESSSWSDHEDPKESSKENKMIQQYLYDLATDISQNGRHHKIQLVITNHNLYDGTKTSRILCDCNNYVIFPGTSGDHHLTYFLQNYVGLSKPQQQKIKTLQSRWVLISKNYPKYVMYAHGVFML